MEVPGKETFTKNPEFTLLGSEILRAASMAVEQLRDSGAVLVVSLDGEVRTLHPEDRQYWLV